VAGVVRSGVWTPGGPRDFDLEGAAIGSPSTLILADMAPGTGPRLHKHPYVESWVVIEGSVRFTAGDEVIEAVTGDVVHVEAELPHRFVVTGETPAKLVCIHHAAAFTTIWLE
jgi:quercetin dioxygenase-like cupin family protein